MEAAEPHDDCDEGRRVQSANESKPVSPSKTIALLAWTVVNTLATIGIVFMNKAIFSNERLKLAQTSFATFHFLVTWLTLYTISRPRFALFNPKKVPLLEIVPLSIAMSLNVILPNLSLAYSSTTFYQMVRILLTPCVAAMNYILYGATVSWKAMMALVPTCAGVGMLSYYDSRPQASAAIKATDLCGVVFGFSGVFASSLYTVWVAGYHRRLQTSSMQLLINQAPISALLLLYVIPFVDTLPARNTVPWNGWAMVLMSGLFASLINISQFFIIVQGGPVLSTVVGHLKTCSIVGLGWMASGRSKSGGPTTSIVVAIVGIIS
ncbi:hypothetical protein PCL_01422 [Purpureocillium lilacinum]|uniref:GDP-mannose transporter n=1 Tax=Purpureocillium lilacinum TaxID=33203 RepID=A0A2U3E3F2_PURLI|nr:hypothetical protein Purlil1_6521 [Purpureocillium lilacinum]PWI69037.1 hypothetical protein PCL_01422 [Purpureocillium lilacinum]